MVESGLCPVCGSAVGADANFCAACGNKIRRSDGENTEALPVVRIGEGRVPMLVIVRGPGQSSRYEITGEVTSIGRHPQSTVFLDDVTVSRQHAQVVSEDGKLIVVDEGSLNGTYVNGARVERHVLSAGDQIQVGKFLLLFTLEAGDGDR